MITADEALVKVLGTSFTVNTKVEGVALIVKTGRVSFSSIADASKNLVVNAGEKALLSDSGITKEPNTDPNFNAWQSKQLSFNDTPLEEVARMIGDAYNVTITINQADAAQIAAKGVTIEFRDQSLSSILKELELITTYEIRQIGEHHYEISIK
jgi:transmembrane sensor